MENMVKEQGLEEFYKGKRILVTGHTGFKGGWLTVWLKKLGAEVAGFALAPEQPTDAFYNVLNVAQGMRSVYGDLRDLGQVTEVVSRHQPDIIFHLGAQALVRRSYEQPVETYAANVMGTAHLLEAARHCKATRAVVVVTSDKCYENREWPWGYRENDRLGGHDPYSSSKGCAELVTAAFRNSFFGPDAGARVATVRAGNVIGGGDWAQDRIVPDIFRAVRGGQSVVIRNPRAIRPWQHVLEPLGGYMMVARKLWHRDGDFASAWNFGPDEVEAVTVEALAQQIVDTLGKGRLQVDPPADQPHETHYLRLDSSKAHSRLSWRPVFSVQEAVALTVQWYQSYLEGGRSMEEVTHRQINQYMQRLEG